MAIEFLGREARSTSAETMAGTADRAATAPSDTATADPCSGSAPRSDAETACRRSDGRAGRCRADPRPGLVCYLQHMRMHIEVDDELVAKVDELAGSRNRSRFVRRAVELAVDREYRWRRLDAAAGSVTAEGHDWDEDPAGWVRLQRRGDEHRGG